MAKLSLRTLPRGNLPFGRFHYVVLLKRAARRTQFCTSNAGEVEKMRDLLRTTCVGDYRLRYELSSAKKRIYTELLLTNSMDLAMIKLVHGDKLHKIYKVKLPEKT